MKMSPEIAVSIDAQLDSDRQNWNTTYEDLARYYAPQRAGFTGERTPGEEKTEYLFDAIGITSAEDLTNYVQSVSTPSGAPWFGIRFRDKQVNNTSAVKKWLEESIKLMHQEIRESNFESEASEYYRDYCVFGTAYMQCLPKYDRKGEYAGLAFKHLSLREMAAQENNDGEIDLTIRSFEWTAGQIHKQFGNDKLANQANLPEVDLDNIKKKYRVIHIIWSRDNDEIDDDAYGYGEVPGSKLPWGSMWVMADDALLIKEGGFYEPCRSGARWYRNADSVNGYSPALLAKPDVKTLNEAKRLEMTAWEKKIDPPILTESENQVGDITLAAGKITTVNDINGTKAWLNDTDFNTVMVKGEEVKLAIRETMFSDIIREPMGDGTQKTRYEVAKRIERATRLLGQATSRLRFEFLSWLVERTFSVMYRNDRLPELPVELQDADIEMDVEYTSPMAISQNSAKLDNIDMFTNRLSMIAQQRTPQDPGQDPIWDYFNEKGYVTEVMAAQSVPAAVVNSNEDVESERKAKADAQANQAKLDAAGQMGEIVQKVGSGAGEQAGRELMDKMGGGEA